jgi:hypothetical protein
VRLFPRVLAKKTAIFSYKNCRFKVESNKMGTARIVLWKEMLVTNSFTLESSFHGYDFGSRTSQQFLVKDYIEVGKSFGATIVEFHLLSR